MISGMDHSHRKQHQTIRNTSAPKVKIIYMHIAQILILVATIQIPFYTNCTMPYTPPPAAWMATILGNLQMLPVPTTDPRHVNTSPMPDENLFCNVYNSKIQTNHIHCILCGSIACSS